MQEKLVNFYDLTWENSHGILPRTDFACFISSRESFPVNKTRGVDYLQKYNFLGEDLTASSEIIYRKILVITFNSNDTIKSIDEYDINKQNKDAEKLFKEVNEAYRVLLKKFLKQS